MNLELRKQREYNVVKANELIQNTRFDLSLIEQKILLILIQKIMPDDKEFQSYEFSIKNFCEICGIDTRNGKTYINCKNAIKSLRDKSFWIKINKKEILCSWINKAIIEEDSGIVQIKLDEDLRPYLLELKKNFTMYSLLNILGMKSKYSIRLYEFLKSYEYRAKITLSIDDLKHKLPFSYNKWYDVKRNVIDIALEEINKFSDITVEYEVVKTGTKVTDITFHITGKERIELFDAQTATSKRLFGIDDE